MDNLIEDYKKGERIMKYKKMTSVLLSMFLFLFYTPETKSVFGFELSSKENGSNQTKSYKFNQTSLYTTCDISIKVCGHFKVVWANGSVTYNDELFLKNVKLDGTHSGNTFTANVTDIIAGITANMEVVFSGSQITSCEVRYTKKSNDVTESLHWLVEEIPKVSSNPNDLFQITGEEVTSKIKILKWEEKYQQYTKILNSFNDSSMDQVSVSWVRIKLFEGSPPPPPLIKGEIYVCQVIGEAELMHPDFGDMPFVLKGGEKLKLDENYRIYTGIDSRVILGLPDNSRFTIHELTDIKLSAFTPDEDAIRTRLWLRAGEISTDVSRTEAIRSDFNVRTPTATMSIRGTMFTVKYDSTLKETKVFVTRGKVTVKHDIGGGETKMAKEITNLSTNFAAGDSVNLNVWQKIIVYESGLGPVESFSLQQIEIFPENVTLTPSDSTIFLARGYDTQGNGMGIPVNWNSTGGTIDSTGLYVAGNVIGTYEVSIQEPIHNLTHSTPVVITGGSAGIGVPIFPLTSDPQYAGDEFWVDIKVGDTTNSVTNLFGLGFTLNFNRTEYIDVVTPVSNNINFGDFLGGDLVTFQLVEEEKGKVNIGMSRKLDQVGVDGTGTVARIKFVSNANTPDRLQVLFQISDLAANDPNGTPITLNPGNQTITIRRGNIVWPGDTNNNGKVDQADVLPIGLYWYKTGFVRSNASTQWFGQICQPWSTLKATYADANGDGKVDQADVLPIGLNWHRTHSLMALGLNLTGSDESLNQSITPSLGFVITGDTDPGLEFWIEVHATDATNLFGIAFELVYSPTNFLEPQVAEPGGWMGNDVIFFPNIDSNAGRVSIGITRKAGQGGVDGSGTIARVKMKMSTSASMGDITNLTLQNVEANDPSARSIGFTVMDLSLVTGIDGKATSIPIQFALVQNYPNPFNPTTTIEYAIPQQANDKTVRLEIFNTVGETVKTLISEQQNAGMYSVQWDGQDNLGLQVPSGVYLYRLRAGSFVDVRKMMLIR